MRIWEIFILKCGKISQIFLETLYEIAFDFGGNLLFCAHFRILIGGRTFTSRYAKRNQRFSQKSVVQGTFCNILAEFSLFVGTCGLQKMIFANDLIAFI